MESKGTQDGIGFVGALTLLFIGLKLTGYIHWPWLWVLAPVWVPFALVLILLAIVGTVALFLKWATND